MDINDIVRLFSEKTPDNIDIKNTSHGDDDFRETLLVDFGEEKIAIKLAANGFTDEKHLVLWERIAKEYRDLGYYCPQYIRSLDGTFPTIVYKDRDCVVWGEEFSKYKSAEELINTTFSDSKLLTDGWYSFLEEAMIMDAKVAACNFDYTDLPSAYCMFETFDPGDKCDETTEDAEKWLNLAKKLPEKYKNRVERIWNNWLIAREELEKIYHKLPTSVFQADINYTNVLLDDDGHFKGVYDFNICGRDVFINYLLRQAPYVSTDDTYSNIGEDDNFLKRVVHALDIVKKVYSFSDLEKKAAALLYKCIRPLWWRASIELEEAGTDDAKICRHLEAVEFEQIREIDFSEHM
ncbi:hypothetical protein [Butyrivibrio sp. MC2013]|uniref:hypothetical protein n=1 Tax=Butyrivibrio sp. MC2013 TaxID=1280686 RepID=UPI000406927B|nr:hypothetical protein [Butyrivibrio sp. MC2013]